MTKVKLILICLLTVLALPLSCGGADPFTVPTDTVVVPSGQVQDPDDQDPEPESPLPTGTPNQVGIAFSTPPSQASDLDGTGWVLESLAGGTPVPGSQITLQFEGDRATGFAGCNSYGGTARAVAGALEFSEIAITAQACLDPEGAMEQESEYLETLLAASAYQVAGDHLEVSDAAGKKVLIFIRQARHVMDPADLVGTDWLLQSLGGADSLQADLGGLSITLAFHSDTLVIGHAACRDYLATYSATGDRLGFSYVAMIDSGCSTSSPLPAIEGQYTDALTWATYYILTDGTLVIETARGEVLQFTTLPDSAVAGLDGTTWVLSAFLDANQVEGLDTPILTPGDVLAGTEITAQFRDGALSGSAGCNRYGGAYAAEGSSFSIETPASTRMACQEPAGILQQEQRYLTALPLMRSYHTYGHLLMLTWDRDSVAVPGTPALLFHSQE